MVFMPHWPVILGRKPISLGLERIHTLLERLDNPHQKLPSVIHVAGTNGKGSTIAFLRAMLEAAGNRVHVYTSPHLVRFNERIVLAGHEIEDEYLTEILEECRIAAEGLEVTFFEGTTAAAFLAFSRVDADVVLLETGLGGRLDATNIIEKPIMNILTSIAMDHMEYLGPTLSDIAGEKAHIMRDNVPCVCSPQLAEVESLIECHAKEVGADTYLFNRDWKIHNDGSQLVYESENIVHSYPLPNLQGIHQTINAGTAITAAHHLQGFGLDESVIAAGLEQAKWPARLQPFIHQDYLSLLPEGSEIWLDGGHNPSAAFMIANWLLTQDALPTYMIVGLTKGKDGVGFFEPFLGKVKKVYGLLITDEPSSQPADMVADAAKTTGLSASTCSDIDEGLQRIAVATNGPCRVLLCGSLFLAAGILKRVA